MKRMLSLTLAALLAVAMFASFTTSPANAESRLSVVTTIFAPYDFARAVAGDLADVTMLLPPGSESHSFEPTPRDILTIQNSDIFIYVGGESDAWVDNILSSMDPDGKQVVTLIDCVEAVEEEIVEGMQDDEDGHDHGELDLSKVYERELTDWNGTWDTVQRNIENGSMERFIANKAETLGLSFVETWVRYIKQFASVYTDIVIDGGNVSFTSAAGTISGFYKNNGYMIADSTHGSAVWYTYVNTQPEGGAPLYLAFNDHGHGGSDGADEEELPHYHIRYSFEDVEHLVSLQEWSPTYFPMGTTAEQMTDLLLGDGGHSHGSDDHDGEDVAYDEHVWTSPRNAKLIVERIADAMCEADPADAESYRANAAAYAAQLNELDASFQEVADNAARKTMVFGDRFPFRYLADAYGLEYYAAFPGCATETEPSAATIKFLIDKVRVEKIPVVFHLELSNEKMADTICEETGAVKLRLHAAHNISKADFDGGVTYIDIMRENVEALREALN